MHQKTFKLKSFFLITTLTLSFVFSAAQAKLTQGKLECEVLSPIAQGYLAHHIDFNQLTDELEKRTILQFINKLDPSKIYLFQADVDKITADLKGIFKKLGKTCTPIEAGQDILIKRLESTVAFAKKTLNDKYKLDETTKLVIDPKLREFPKNETEAQAQLLKFIHFQISNYLASDMKLPQAKKQLIHRYELNLKRQKEFRHDELYALFLDAFASSLDAHSGFLPKDMLEDFEISMRLSLEGIGAALTWEDGYTTVDNLIPGGSAERSGEILPKDKIIAVAQGSHEFEHVIDMPLRDVVKLIRGKKGTIVRLSILRESAKGTTRHIVSLTRDKINLQDEAAQLTYTTRKENGKDLKIAVIELPSFYGDMTRHTRSSYEDLKKLIEKAAKEKADGLVLDLSRNGGGLLSEAVRISGLFLKKGNVVATQDSQQKMDILADTDDAVEWNGPLVVLTSRLSASASEIVSGTLQDYKRALIVGADHTFGKGTVQAMINLPADLGAIKVTTGLFFIPGGNSTQHRGVISDVAFPSVFATKDLGEASLDYSLPPKKIATFSSTEANDSSDPALHWTPVKEDLIKKLRVSSDARVSKDSEFKKIKEELAELESRKGTIQLADSLKKQKEEKQKDKKIAKKHRKRDDAEYLKQPNVSEAVNIMADMIKLMGPSEKQAKN